MTAGPSSSASCSAFRCRAGATVLCQPRALSAVAGAAQRPSSGGAKPGTCPHLWPLTRAAMMRPAEAAFPAAAGREEAGRQCREGSGCRQDAGLRGLE